MLNPKRLYAGFPNTTILTTDTEAFVTLLFGAADHDAHVRQYRFVRHFYGSTARYLTEMAERRAARERARAQREAV